MNYADFVRRFDESKESLFHQIYQDNRDIIKIKKEATAIKNFEKIFDAVFRITYEKGFQAMTMRDLSRETQLSMGALYAYFQSKDELLTIIQRQGRTMIKRVLESHCTPKDSPLKKLTTVVKAHLFLSELAKPWFYFNFMEAKNLSDTEREAILASEAYTETILFEILEDGEQKGVFQAGNHMLTASIIKAMQQEWYLKRWKYTRRNVSVDDYAACVLGFIESYCVKQEGKL
ncbi:MAG: TetR/AcrR family transcriptional regulator [Candidatus Magnetomorum sp.]|nr:TetR/AcrR family transcriptional regulator [Candidatus Magnetomorum sp.]